MIDSHIIGQKSNIETIDSLINGIKARENYNILIIGPSGYGKTYIADLIVRLANRVSEAIIYNGDVEEFFNRKTIHILDEAHAIKTPENLYYHMDSGKYTFIILTNEYGSLKEPFRNRCIDIHLTKYTEEELGEISNLVFKEKANRELSKEQRLIFGEKARGTPRIAKNIAERVLIFTRNRVPVDEKELRKILGILAIYKGGFRESDRRYLQFLTKVETASLNTISQSLGLDSGYVKNEIEPFLLEKGVIKITSKGRTINKKEND